MRPRRPEFRQFVYLAARAPENIDRLAHLADGAAYPAVRPEIVAATHVARTPGAVVERFSKTIGSVLDKMAANGGESRTLTSLRDTLLPKLITGELRVKDAERFLKERGL